jgi:hypothetical protein
MGGIGGRGEDFLADGEGRDFALREIEEAAFAGAARLHDGGDHHARSANKRDDLVGIVHVHAEMRGSSPSYPVSDAMPDVASSVLPNEHVHAFGSGIALAGDRCEHEAAG